MEHQIKKELPADGLEGLKKYFASDVMSGFFVFLLALPLSLGIAKASEFPPIMGLVTAIIGGLVATFFAGSKLTIKGPAAGLIVIVAGAVNELGGGEVGWHLALGVMVVAGIVQILFGLFKWGKLVDFFPLSAVHGMLAAIGLIIIAKQIPVLLNVDPSMTKGLGPLALLGHIPQFIANLNPNVTAIGLVSLAIMMLWPKVTNKTLKMVPAPLLVLFFAIPAGMYFDLANGPAYNLVKVGSLIEKVRWNVDFGGIAQIGVFIKYVIMVSLVGSLESLLTVKAIDGMDPYKRKSDPNKDIIAVGIANTLAAFVGGLPMISEVARSSANVLQGAKTRWANFFHGIFLLFFALAAYPLLEKIPNAALAAMLITVGIKLAHPKEFLHTYKIGPEQLAIFVTTIFFTLFEDLLVGIGAGILLKIVIHLFRGASLKSLFKANTEVKDEGENLTVTMHDTALFSNYLGIKKTLDGLPQGKKITIDLKDVKIIDHSVMENLHLFEHDYALSGGHVSLAGLDEMDAISEHPLAARRKAKGDRPVNIAKNRVPVEFNEKHILHELKHYLPSQLALKDFVHHNSLHAFQDQDFFEGIFSAAEIFGIKATFNLGEYRKLYANGRIKSEIIDQVIERSLGKNKIATFKNKMLEGSYEGAPTARIGVLRAHWKKDYQIDLDNRVQPLLFRILCSFVDQGIAIWHFPFGDKNLIEAVRTLEQNSFVSFFSSPRAKALLFDESTTIEQLLDIVVGHSAFYEQYLYDQQFAHKGWSGFFAAVESTPETLLYSKQVRLKDLILLELLLEIDALDKEFGTTWKPLSINVQAEPEDYFRKVELTEAHQILKLWQEAFEWDYYDEVLSGVGHLNKTNGGGDTSLEKTFQGIFCIDDREDSIRRNMEMVDPSCETLGAPGFFGAAFYFQPFGGKFFEKQAPAPAQPKHLIKELTAESGHAQEYFHSKHSHTFLRGFLMSLSLGLWASGRMILDLFKPKMRPDIADAFSHMDMSGTLLIENIDPNQIENGLQVGYTVKEMAGVVEGLLRGIGMVKSFAPIVYMFAHGSSSANNPHHGAHDCGACSGRPGAVNARVFAFMANHLKVRAILANNGLVIPESTQFLGAMHDTASDEIRYYDLENLSPVNQKLHERNLQNIEAALDLNAKERARRFASIDISQDIKKVRTDIKNRSVSYFEPRPELGHGTNALCYVGARHKMKGLFLDRRAFLNSYDYRTDPEGIYLKQVMGPLPVVCGGINLEYYFSRMDIEKMGAGTKLPHNVMGLVGVSNSTDGDLRPGLPLQMIENHDPVRLLLMVEHKPEVVMNVIKTSPGMFDWFDKGWIHLVAVSPEDGHLYLLENGKFELYRPTSEVKNSDDILKVIESANEMETNHILDATKENIPVHIYPSLN